MRKLNAIQELWLRTPEMVSSVMIGLLLMAIGAFVHHDILYGMVQVWRNDVTFYHCFCVGPIFLFLIYRKRQGVICAVPHFEPISLPVIIISGFGAYIFGEIGVNLLAHIAFVILLQALFIATIGRNGFKILRFPILFLFFLVPFGHELRLPLQNMTAAVAVFMLENSGIDVAFRGIYIATDRIEFVVAEACAGLRFLIANIFAMALYAHFSFKTKKSWLIFLPLSIVIPIIGNILRAYFIMMIGYYSNGELAADIDHIIYGWGFFCLLAYVNFHIGEKISKAEPPMSEKDMDKIDLSYSYKAYNLEPIGSIFHKKHFPATIFALFAVFGLDYHLSRLAGRQGHFHAEHIQDYAPREISSVFAENWQKRQESVDFGFQNYDFTTYYTNVKNDVGAGVIHFKMQNSLKDVT
ncbi:MAG: exosortase A, partial [Pseudomonadota bacterium]